MSTPLIPTRHVLIALAAVVATAAALLPAAPATATNHDYQQTLDISFPTRRQAHYADTYDACRSGCERKHKATDLMGAKMWPVYATVDGVICRLDDGAEDSYGRHITVCGDDGRRYRYLHLNNDTPGTDDGKADLEHVFGPYIRQGVRVARGQHIAYMGDSGNAEWTGAHIHLDVFDDRVTDPYGDNRINPYPSLQAAWARGDYPDGSAYFARPTRRVAGPDRVGTAVAVSREAYKRSQYVVIAPAEHAAETIVAGPLAAAVGAPVLTTASRGLDHRVAAEMKRLGASRAYLVGDSLSSKVETGLVRAGIRAKAVRRLAGANRFQTAAVVAEEVWRLTGVGGDALRATGDDRNRGRRRALVALGSHPNPTRAWPDALMASYYGAAVLEPVLLVEHNRMPVATATALATAERATIFGGDGAIRPALAAEVTRRVERVGRLAGASRVSTAIAVTEDLRRRDLIDADTVWGATGHNWPDAVTAGPAVAKQRDAFVLLDGYANGGDRALDDWLAGLRATPDRARVVGGPGVVIRKALVGLARRIA